MDTKTILVIGATGKIGRYITQGLSHHNFRIRAMVRDTFKARSIHPPNVELIQGDLFNISDLEKAVQGVDGIYINLNPGKDETRRYWHTMAEGLNNLIIVSRLFRVKHLMMHGMICRNFTSPNQPEWNAGIIQNKAIELLKNSGLPYTIFNSSLFFENFTHHFRNGNTIRILGYSSFPIYWLSAVDFGKQAARAFFNPHAINKEFTTQGIEPRTMQDAAQLYVSERKSEKLRLTQMGGNLLRLMARIRPKLNEKAIWFDRVNSYPEKFQSEEAWELFGLPATTFSEFARKGNPLNPIIQRMPNFYKASVLN